MVGLLQQLRDAGQNLTVLHEKIIGTIAFTLMAVGGPALAPILS